MHKDEIPANQAHAAVCNILIKAKPPSQNKEEKKSLAALRKDDGIVIAKADKGNVTVIIDKSPTSKKQRRFLKHRHPKKMSKDPTNAIERKINS